MILLHTHEIDYNNKKKSDHKYWEGCGKLELSYITGGNVKWHNHLRNSSEVLRKLGAGIV